MKDKDGCTPLHYAVKNSQSRIVKKLLQRGADRNVPDFKREMTPVMLARNKPEILEIFRKKGICEKLFFKPDISKKTLCSNKNMILFIVLHVVIFIFVFFLFLPYFQSDIFSGIYIAAFGLVFILYIILSFSNPGKMINYNFHNLLDIVEQGNDAEDFFLRARPSAFDDQGNRRGRRGRQGEVDSPHDQGRAVRAGRHGRFVSLREMRQDDQ